MAIQNARVKFALVPAGKSMPASVDQNTIYFLQDANEIRVGDAVIACPTDLSDYDTSSEVASAIETALNSALGADISVAVTGTGNYVSSASFANKKLTLTMSNLPSYVMVKKGTANSGAAASYQLQKDGVGSGVDIDIPAAVSYTIEKLGTAESGASATYQLKAGGNYVGAKINIPKDMVISSGVVKSVTTANSPYTGAVVGDKYIELTIANNNGDKIYIPVKELVDTYTAGTGITVSNNNQISVDTSTIATREYADNQATAAQATWTVIA